MSLGRPRAQRARVGRTRTRAVGARGASLLLALGVLLAQTLLTPGPQPATAATSGPGGATHPTYPRDRAAYHVALTKRRIHDAQGSYARNDGPVAGYANRSMRGRPIIIVQFEALQTMVVGAKVAGQPVVPNVDAFARQSWYFPNTFSQISRGNTADAEFVAATSLLPPVGSASPVEYADYRLPSYPRMLRNMGYDVYTMHANDARYWNRVELYPALGFSRYFDRDWFGYRDWMWKGVSDDVFFQRALGYLNARRSSRPVCLQLITLSSHIPYVFPPDSRRPLKLPADLRDSYAGDYVTAESYADAAFGRFVAGLKRSGLWDRAVVIVYGDHMALKDLTPEGADKVIMDQLLGRPYTYADRQRVPLMIHLPGQTRGTRVASVRGMQDIMPTVADLVDYDLSGTPHFGRSAFEGGPRLVPMRQYFPTGSFVSSYVTVVNGADGDVRTMRTSDGAPLSTTDRQLYDVKRVRALNSISETWVRTLPVRPDAGDSPSPIYPTGVGK